MRKKSSKSARTRKPQNKVPDRVWKLLSLLILLLINFFAFAKEVCILLQPIIKKILERII